MFFLITRSTNPQQTSKSLREDALLYLSPEGHWDQPLLAAIITVIGGFVVKQIGLATGNHFTSSHGFSL